MNLLEFVTIVGIGSFIAGLISALTGIGGGLIITPLLTLALNVDIRYAVGAALIGVIATSSGAAATYVKEGYSNIRVGMFLEIPTTIGALGGGFLVTLLPVKAISIIFSLFLLIFSLILLYNLYAINHGKSADNVAIEPDSLATKLLLNSTCPTPEGEQYYYVQRVPLSFGMMFLAGLLSALLGIGSGILKVMAMDQFMQIPFKTATATSNFMIGITAATSASIYLQRGYIDPSIAMPVTLGVLAGSMVGATILSKISVILLRWIFTGIMLFLTFQMVFNTLISPYI